MRREPAKLDALLDTAALMAELNVKRTTAEAIMRQLPKIAVPGVRKSYVRRDDVKAFIDENTRAA